MPFALVLIVLSAAWRIVPLYVPALFNFSPFMALAFCGAVYFTDKRMWVVPFAALTLSDLYLDHYWSVTYHYEWSLGGAVLRMACFVAGLGLGAMVARQRTWPKLFGGVFAASVFFYLVTNTASWLGDATYSHDLAGWWQALTRGHPEYAPTWTFYRNTLLSDLLFTGLFAVTMEAAARRRGEESLLAKRVEA